MASNETQVLTTVSKKTVGRELTELNSYLNLFNFELFPPPSSLKMNLKFKQFPAFSFLDSSPSPGVGWQIFSRVLNGKVSPKT